MDLLLEILMAVAAIYACVIFFLICVICYKIKTPGGQQFDFFEASLPDSSPPDYKENNFLDLDNGINN